MPTPAQIEALLHSLSLRRNTEITEADAQTALAAAEACKEAISERNTIEAATIKRCAEIAGDYGAHVVAKRIRALRPASGENPES